MACSTCLPLDLGYGEIYGYVCVMYSIYIYKLHNVTADYMLFDIQQ